MACSSGRMTRKSPFSWRARDARPAAGVCVCVCVCALLLEGGWGGPMITAEDSTVQAGSSCCMVRHTVGDRCVSNDAMACCACRQG